MVSFVSSESRHTTEYIEHSVDRFREVLKSEQLLARLGEKASTLVALTDDFYIPNVVHGEVRIPDSLLESDRLPIFALRPKGEVWLDPNFAAFTPLRREQATQYIKSLEPIAVSAEKWIEDYQESGLKHARSIQEVRSVKDAAAAVVTRAYSAPSSPNEFKNGQDDKKFFSPRPLFLMRRARDLTSPAVMSHELEHVLQGNMQPVRLTNDYDEFRKSYRDELEAYSVGAQVSAEMLGMGMKITQIDKTGIALDETRIMVQGNNPDPFDPTPELAIEYASRKLPFDL